MERVKNYISNSAPEYRNFWLNSQDEIDAAIDQETTSETQIDLELYKIRQRIVLNNKSEAKKILKEKIEDIKDTDKYLSRYEKVMKAVSDDGRADLARYIVQRRVILDLLEKSLQLQQTGKYCYEEVFHNIIMPKGFTSDDIQKDAHNLWLIDEKLAYHYYLASDVPFNLAESHSN
jgi:folate-binding Fe-S cluster repair protein YgfZ